MTTFRTPFLLFAAALTVTLPLAAAQGTLARGPYLQQSTADSIVVVWRTTGGITPVVRFGDTPRALNREVSGNSVTVRVSVDVPAAPGGFRLYQEPYDERENREADHDPSTPPNTHQYEAHITGLRPATKYHYAVFDGNRRLAGGDNEHYFVTHPPIGSAANLRLWVVGDSGTGERDQAMVHEAARAYVQKTGRRIDHYLHVGDMAYSDGTDREFQTTFFEPYASTLRNTVCWPAMGNHEGHTSRGISGYGPYYDGYVVPTRAEAGGVPSGTEAYYSFDIGRVHFICLDSHDLDRDPDAAMARWLRADLEQTKADWLIAFWHHPPYTMGSHNSDREEQLIEMRENFMPILEAAGVDLTLTGHSHIYERSMLMDGAYATPTVATGVILDDGDGNPAGDGAYRKSAGLQPHAGSVSIVAGHGGAGLGREGTMPVMREIILEHGSVILDIDSDTLNAIMLNKEGQTRDVFSIVKRGSVTPTRVANPWQPKHDISLLTEVRTHFAGRQPGAQVPDGWTLAQGRAGGLNVMAGAKEGDRFLRAQATGEPMTVLFSALPVQAFEFEAELRFPADATKGISMVFGYADASNHGLVELDPAAGMIRAIQYINGNRTVLVEKSAAIPKGEWFVMGIESEGTELGINFNDDTLEFETELKAALPKAPVGFLVPAGGSVDLEEMVVENEGWGS